MHISHKSRPTYVYRSIWTNCMERRSFKRFSQIGPYNKCLIDSASLVSVEIKIFIVNIPTENQFVPVVKYICCSHGESCTSMDTCGIRYTVLWRCRMRADAEEATTLVNPCVRLCCVDELSFSSPGLWLFVMASGDWNVEEIDQWFWNAVNGTAFALPQFGRRFQLRHVVPHCITPATAPRDI